MSNTAFEEAIEEIISKLPDKEWVEEFVSRFDSPEIKTNILGVLERAAKAEKSEEAKELLELRYENHWKFQHPDIRGTILSPKDDLWWRVLHEKLGVPIPSDPESDQPPD